MRIILSLVALFIFMGVFYGNSSVWAEVSSVETDKHCYSRSEKITISGQVDHPTTKQVNIIFTNRVGGQVSIKNALVLPNNTFVSLPFDIDEIVKGMKGIYIINAYIDESSEQKSTRFTFEGCSVTPSNPNQLVQAPNFGIITSDEISLITNKPSYLKGEIIVISGNSTKWFGSNVTIKIISPTGKIIKAESIPIDTSKNFKTELQTGNEQFKDTGTYSIRATYGPKPILAQITFQFDGQEQRTESPNQPAPVESPKKPAPVEPTTQPREEESQNPPTVSLIEFIEQLILTNNLIVIFSIIVIAAGIGIVYLVKPKKNSGKIKSPPPPPPPPPPEPLAVSISASQLNGIAPFTVMFTAFPRGGSVAYTNYSWRFGEGIQTTTSAIFSHTYRIPGSYNATVTVTDSDGKIGVSSTVAIIVTSNEPEDEDYVLLGLSRNCTCEELKSGYKKKVKEHHKKGTATMTKEEFYEWNKKFTKINKARDRIREEKGCQNW